MMFYVKYLLLIFLIILSFSIPFLFVQERIDFNEIRDSKITDKVLSYGSQSQAQPFPVRLIIPGINVDAHIEYVALTPKGIMATPKDVDSVGWFDLGPRPGEKGSAVIAGHSSGIYGESAVFADLYKLKVGDYFYIQDERGQLITFIVRGSKLFDPGYAEEVFSSSNVPHLNLITCDGTWDNVTKTFNKRLVVFSDIVN